MDHLNSLSDQQLRQRLLQYGFPNLPITSTTRGLLIKKLRNHMDSEQAKLKQATSYVTRYSSDEDTSDKETKRHQRTTMPPPKTNRKSTNPPTITKISPRSQSVYVSPVVRHLNTDSEDDADQAENNLSSAFSARSMSENSRTHTRPRTSTLTYPTTSRSFISGYDRSSNTSLSQSREHSATSNGHSNELTFDSPGLSTHYPRSAMHTTPLRKYNFFVQIIKFDLTSRKALKNRYASNLVSLRLIEYPMIKK